MDAPESSNSQTNDEAAFVEYASRDAAQVWPETHTHVTHPSLYGAIPTATPDPALPVNDIFGVSLGQITGEATLLSWQQMEIDYFTFMQLATAEGLPIPPTVDASTALIGQGQVFNTDFGVSTTHQADPSVFGYQEASSWPNPSKLASPPTSAIWYSNYSYAQPPMEPLSSHHIGAFGALGDVHFTSTATAPLPPPLRPAKTIKKTKRAKPGNTCQGCSLRHKKCHRNSSCLELAAKFYGPGIRSQISTKLEIMEMIEVGSYFSNWGHTPSCEIFSGYEWQTFHEVFSLLQLRNDEVYLTLSASFSNIDCIIPLGMVYSCFEVLPKKGTRSPSSTPSRVLKIIKGLVKLHPSTEFVYIHQPTSDRKARFISWTSAISFCSRNSYTWGLIDKVTEPSSDEFKERVHELFMSTRKKFREASHQGQKQTPEESADASDHPNMFLPDTSQNGKDELRVAELCKWFKDELRAAEIRKYIEDEVSTVKREPTTNDVAFQLSWIVSRYLELCIFGYIQKFFNTNASRNSKLEKPRTQAEMRNFIALIFSILTSVERPLPTSKHLESASLSVAIKGFIDRQDKIRSALWMCCSVMISKLDSFQDCEMWTSRCIPSLSPNGLPRPFWASLESFDQQNMEAEKELDWGAQPFPLEQPALTSFLDAMKPCVIASESSGYEKPRSVELGKSAHDIIQQLQKDGKLSSLGQRKFLQHCLGMIKMLLISIKTRSKAKLAGAKAHIAQLMEILCRQVLADLSAVLDNLWF